MLRTTCPTCCARLLFARLPDSEPVRESTGVDVKLDCPACGSHVPLPIPVPTAR